MNPKNERNVNMEQPLIETKDLRKYFKTPKGNLHAVDGINLSIKKGNTLGVVGESGCGKSTLGRTILRLIEPTSGEVLYNGDNIIGYDKRKMNQMRKKNADYLPRSICFAKPSYDSKSNYS